MTPKEVFRLFEKYPEDSSYVTGILEKFMDVEMEISYLEEIPYSCLEVFQEVKSRTCKICGCVSCSNMYGNGLVDCENESCVLVRVFFNIKNNFSYPAPAPTCGKKGNYQMANWYRSTLDKTFGVKQIYKIPIENRIQVLLAMMLMKKAINRDNDVIEQLAA